MTLVEAVPVLDASLLDEDPEEGARQLGEAWQHIGFITVSGHGVDPKVIQQCREATRAFFALPDEVKRAYYIAGGGGQRGYTPFGIETAKDASVPDRKEFWHVGREFAPGSPLASQMPGNVWPEDVAGFQSACLDFFTAMDDLGQRLLVGVARFLGLPADYFTDRVSTGNSILRLLHYPPCVSEEPGERAAAHEDINVITLLGGADQAGLEVQRRDGRWIPIETDSDAIVCNVGDMLARLTNTVLPSTTHRVIGPTGDAAKKSRYSMPFFLHFAPDVEIATLPSCVSANRPNQFPEPITARAFLDQRLAEIGLT